AGPLDRVAAVLVGLAFMALAGKVLATESKQDATKLFAYSIVYTLALFTALTVDAALGGPRMVGEAVNQAAWIQALTGIAR
ncbi:MAG: hypothetical protein ACK46X_18780, partial [Candidatus Sericytochromatia bacterium]